MPHDRAEHWKRLYATKREREVSWFEAEASLSLSLIKCRSTASDAVIDIGGGTSRLADGLLDAGYLDITVLDLSREALDVSKRRLGARSSGVAWFVADVTEWQPPCRYHIWHDRAAFHFLTAADDQAAYAACLRKALHPGGCAIIGTFALDGPERCSGLPVKRYSALTLAQTLGEGFELIEWQPLSHRTPAGNVQEFQFSVFCRRGLA
jgi:SAM-dependent methyltransferase